jgi:hypothetical protein
MSQHNVPRRLVLFIVAVAATIGVGVLAGPAGAATIQVSTTTALSNAVANANAGDTIEIAGGSYDPDAPLDVTKQNVTIERDPSTTGQVVIIGNNVTNTGTTGTGGDDVVEVEPNASATIQNISIRQTPSTGSGIDVLGQLDLESSDLQGNNNAGITAEQGSVVTIENSLVSLSTGPGIDAIGRVHLFNSTVAHNTHGGVFMDSGTVSAVNTIISNNGIHDCPNGPVSSQSHSLDSDGTCDVQMTANPKLGALVSSGITSFYPLTANSPAIDHGANLTCPAVDQRGVSRALGASNPNCDIGSYEYVDTTNPVVTVPSDITVNPTGSTGAKVPYSVSATDDTAIASLVCSPASGALFPVGTTQVSCTATDTHNNNTTSTFNVIVRTPQTITVTLPTPPDTLPEGTVTVSATSTSGLPVTFSSLTPTICTSGGANGSVFTLIEIGSCKVAADQSGNATFAPAKEAVKPFTIAAGKQSIVFSPTPPTTGTAGTTVTLSATTAPMSPVNGPQPSSDVTFSTATDPSICTVSGNVVTLVGAGSCVVAANAASDGSYAAATQVSKTITIKGAAQTISWTPASTSVSVAGGPVTLNATASSGLPITYTTTAAATVCTISGSTLTPVGPGSCSVKASQAGNAQFAAATAVTKTFTITA